MTIQLIHTIVALKNCVLRKLDVSNVFLHCILEETVFMNQPLGFPDKDKSYYMYRFLKSIYYLKQLSHTWFRRFRDYLIKLGFKVVYDLSLFVYSRDRVIAYFLIYVDDIVITFSSLVFVIKVIEKLGCEFSIKNLGPLQYFLRIHVSKISDGIFLS